MTADRRPDSPSSGRPLGSLGDARTQSRTGHEALLIRLGFDVPAFTLGAYRRRVIAFKCEMHKGMAAGLAAALGGGHGKAS